MEASFISDFFKKHSRVVILIVALVIGALLLFFSSVGAKTTDSAEQSLDEYLSELEERVAKSCSSVRGVGKCKVLITLERGEQSTYKGSSLIEVKPPKVLGVSVICEGADSDSVRLALTEMLTALFDIGTNRISILKLK